MSLPLPFSHKGLPVPDIAAWSGERLPPQNVVIANDGIAFASQVGLNGFALGRDTHGALWQRWALRQGDGRPDLGKVHGPRQRRAMRKFLCQVCGGPSDENEQGRLYLLEDYQGTEGWPEGEVTTHPPLCRAHAPLAARLCPHLRGRVVAVRARDVSVDGVHGMVYKRGNGLVPIATKKQVVFHGDWRIRWTLANQLAVTLRDCTLVDLDELSAEAAVRTNSVA
ncbi:hypothetical protein [Streptomyces sp. SP17KL33]|uniref:hypothetical protein n=1 Tax=Streptomyces sp. SP17KL33 TaxID=3002534 RepID=UPI002E7A141E|nr:hypothetical protein [Streptomyces sp. SP17KL33]MEE1838106.1 hypothetical protein [Streptomyces sp. SP17KL33]